MTKEEEKQLLLKDICARLRYSLICKVTHKDSEGWKEENMVLSGIIYNEGYFTSENGSAYSYEFKPYLRPMSSITEEEKKIMRSRGFELIHYDTGYTGFCNKSYVDEVSFRFMDEFLNSHHFDYRGLIEKGLALEAPENMYK